MFIQPQGEIYILRNVPLNVERKHTRLFNDVSTQFNYFKSKYVRYLTNFTYVRENSTIKLPIPVDTIKDCNYCMFRNLGYNDKWFYAFITQISYINNETCEITIELDSFQTWHIDMKLGASYVEREHVANDNIGVNTVPEDIDIGEHIVMANSSAHFGTNPFGANLRQHWCAQITVQPSALGIAMGMLFDVNWRTELEDNQIVGQRYTLDIGLGSAADVNNYIHDFINQNGLVGNDISEIVLYPGWMGIARDRQETIENLGDASRPTAFKSLDGSLSYTPRNNKLLTYPYTYLSISNNQGDTLDLKYENFNDNQYDFTMSGYLGNGVSCDLRPNHYEYDNGLRNHLLIENFPKCTFSSNALARATTDVLASVLRTNINKNKTYTSQSNLGYSESETNKQKFKTTKRSAKQKQYTQTKTNTTDYTKESSNRYTITNENVIQDTITDMLGTLGTTASSPIYGNNNNLMVKDKLFGYDFYCMGIKKEYAEIVDKYFDMYGYKVNKFKAPEIHTRSRWNFVKTYNCNIMGDIPIDAVSEISAMFDSGLTLWHDNDIENYSRPNEKIIQG